MSPVAPPPITDTEIERVARRVATALGHDPDKTTLLLKEQAILWGVPLDKIMKNRQAFDNSGFWVPTWMTFRHRAREALAMRWALGDVD